jgi:hypothetical protein
MLNLLTQLLALILFSTLASFEGQAVLITTNTGTENTTAPADDPGFANIANVIGLSGVYVGNGWMLTANHVGARPALLQGVSYAPVPGSGVQFQDADLIAYKLLDAKPPLPDLTLASSPPTLGTLVTLIGNGLTRGTPTTWDGHNGWNWNTSRAIRWGKNEISEVAKFTLNTHAFWIRFDSVQPAEEPESDIVIGDSGGGAFIGSGASAELIGILYARSTYTGQPANTSLYGTSGAIVDLFAYRTEILTLIGQPDCSDGLDDDGDGLTDYPNDPGCTDAQDPDERGPSFECDNGIDDDLNGQSDYPNDMGCTNAMDALESTPPVGTGLPGAGILVLGSIGLLALTGRRIRSIVVD